MPKILLIEDDEDIRDDLAELLMDEGYRVITTSNGQEAWDELESGVDPTVIVLDLMMPVMSGWDFRQRQLSDPRLAKVPVVVLSGVADAWLEAQRLEAAACIEKPIELDRLFDALERCSA